MSTDFLIKENKNSEIVREQLNKDYNVLTLEKFEDGEEGAKNRDAVLAYLGDDNVPQAIQVYPKDFSAKKKIVEYLDKYNKNKDESNKILGVIATKDVTHIALFFVDGKYHKQGIGKKLYYKVESLNNNEFFTVNSSPYAHEVYKHLGFIDTDKEQSIKGLRFYPMKKNLK